MASKTGPQDGIINPSGASIAGFIPLYLVGLPITSYLTQPNGIMSKVVNALVSALVTVGTAGSSTSPSTIPADRVIPALSALYVFWTFGGSGAVSAAGQAMSRPEGLDASHSRSHVSNMRGLPLRMYSAHYALVENFPGFALAAAMTQALAPRNAQLVNLLGLHVVAKLFVHYPVYLLDVPPPRTMAHVLATSAVINVLWRLAMGAA